MLYIKTQIPIIEDQHAEILAEKIITVLPDLFTEKPEIFSKALLMAGGNGKAAAPSEVGEISP
ncbi:hypothetical protein [Nostoc sp.]|uniref:hypothetical protein n=1 Tax=Nostoc sp. TaxID=1180 RepID=UPI002FF60397